MRSNRRAHSFLALDDIQPSVQLAGYWRYPKDQWFENSVPSHQLLLVETGRIVSTHPEGPAEAVAGDLVCFRSIARRHYETRGPTAYYQIHLEFAPPPRDRLTPRLDEVGLLPTRVRLGDGFDRSRRLFETVCIEITEAGAAHRLRVRAAIEELLAIVAEVLARLAPTDPHLDDWQRARLQLGFDLKQPPRVGEIARQMGISRYYFTQQFKQRFGISPHEFHMRARLSEAVRRLRGGEKSVKAVASELGFADTKSLRRACKQYLDARPGDFLLSATPTTAKPPLSKQGLFPVNTHLLAPQYGRKWFEPKYGKLATYSPLA